MLSEKSSLVFTVMLSRSRGLLQKGQDYSPPKFCFVRSPAFLVGTTMLMGIYSAMNVRITKQIGGGVNGWSYCNVN